MIEATTSDWLQHYPKPQWFMADPATAFTSQEFGEWTSRLGFGLFITAGEAHWMLGSAEGLLKVLKATAQRLLVIYPELTIYGAACLALTTSKSAWVAVAQSSGHLEHEAPRRQTSRCWTRLAPRALPGPSFAK